jgi:hypothetical protein
MERLPHSDNALPRPEVLSLSPGELMTPLSTGGDIEQGAPDSPSAPFAEGANRERIWKDSFTRPFEKLWDQSSQDVERRH